MLKEPVLVDGALDRFFLGGQRWMQLKIRAEMVSICYLPPSPSLVLAHILTLKQHKS